MVDVTSTVKLGHVCTVQEYSRRRSCWKRIKGTVVQASCVHVRGSAKSTCTKSWQTRPAPMIPHDSAESSIARIFSLQALVAVVHVSIVQEGGESEGDDDADETREGGGTQLHLSIVHTKGYTFGPDKKQEMLWSICRDPE